MRDRYNRSPKRDDYEHYDRGNMRDPSDRRRDYDRRSKSPKRYHSDKKHSGDQKSWKERNVCQTPSPIIVLRGLNPLTKEDTIIHALGQFNIQYLHLRLIMNRDTGKKEKL